MSAAAPGIQAIHFLAGAEVPRDLAADIIARASRRMAVPCHLEPDVWETRPVRLGGRDQIDADALLAGLDVLIRPGIVHVGLTGLDLGLALFTFVFGRARRGGQTAVVSLARLDPTHYGLAADPDLTARRSVAEIIHEIGHVAGLVHCDDFSCVMHFAPNVETIDLRGTAFCPACARALPPHLVLEQVNPRGD